MDLRLTTLATHRAAHPRHLGMHEGPELEKVQVLPDARLPVVDRLVRRPAARTRQAPGLAAHVEVDLVGRLLEPHRRHLPRRRQTQRRREQLVHPVRHDLPRIPTPRPRQPLTRAPSSRFHTNRHRPVFCGRLALGRHRYRSCQPQPTASKPLPAKEMVSRTLAWPPEKTENREASVGAKTPPSQGWRSRGQARKPRQHWGNGQKKIPTDEGWDFGYWWWGGTLRQTYVTQRLTTAANSCGKVRNPAPATDNPTSSNLAGSPTERIRQDASSIPICGIEPASARRLLWPDRRRPERVTPAGLAVQLLAGELNSRSAGLLPG